MKINGEIELSGITEVVYNKKHIWKKHTINDKIIWVCAYIYYKNVIAVYTLLQNEMMTAIKNHVNYKLTRVWVSGNTVNIDGW